MKNLLLFLLAIPALAADPVWLQYGPGGSLIARTLVAGNCPQVTVDGNSSAMAARGAASTDYPLVACEATLPADATSASIGGVALPLPGGKTPQRIAIIGDTGCRVKCEGDDPTCEAQRCTSPSCWPFAKMAKTVADWKPDLVIHVGDYYYRENNCPVQNDCKTDVDKTQCSGKVYDWTNWAADFFTPVAPLLGTAPWIFIRGNHESCGRAAEGWFRFLDPAAYAYTAETCNEYTDPFTVPVGGMQFLVMDSSEADDEKIDPGQVKTYSAQLQTLAAGQPSSPNAWILLHHPMWAVRQKKDKLVDVTGTMYTAFDQASPAPKLAAAITGHVHIFEALQFSDGRPPQLIIGNGGTLLAKNISINPVGDDVGDREIQRFTKKHAYGWAAVTHDGGKWKFRINDPSGDKLTTCLMEAGKLQCK